LATRADLQSLVERPEESRSYGVLELELDSEFSLRPTDWTRHFTRTWLSRHGRRFRVYKPSKKKRGLAAKKQEKTGTMADLARKLAAGSKNLLAAASKAPVADKHRTVLGVPRSEFVRRREQHNPAASAPKLVKYRKFTQTKKQRKRLLENARGRTRGLLQNPYTIGCLNPNKRLRLGTGRPAATGTARTESSSRPRKTAEGSMVRVLNMTGAALPDLGSEAFRYTIQQLADSKSNTLIESTLRAHLVVWKHSWELDRSVPDAEFLKSAFLVVAAGKAVLGLGNWKGRQPHESSSVVSYAAAVETVPATLVLQEPLVSKHLGLCHVIKRCGKLPKSKWQVLSSMPGNPSRQPTKLATVHDARSFLQSVRRLRTRDAAGGYFPPTRR